MAELLTDPRAGQVRECEAPDCVLLFLPAHPRRRWCVAGVCGNGPGWPATTPVTRTSDVRAG
ncbi:CGNR zinc finger domain-containing protein [Streptomyces erythrochromogenes]|uniref:CGNR zinc finger domain-containing protein n=1 Tax=Streptomyces erythrochromogenes TaxID=285574 RepID=UPI003631BFEE